MCRKQGSHACALRFSRVPLKLSTRTWSGRAPWNRGKFVDWSRGKQWDLLPWDPQCSSRPTVSLGPGIKFLMFDNILLYRMLTQKDCHYQLVRGLLWTVNHSLHSPISTGKICGGFSVNALKFSLILFKCCRFATVWIKVEYPTDKIPCKTKVARFIWNV